MDPAALGLCERTIKRPGKQENQEHDTSYEE
jgi:hypothetical protein